MYTQIQEEAITGNEIKDFIKIGSRRFQRSHGKARGENKEKILPRSCTEIIKEHIVIIYE